MTSIVTTTYRYKRPPRKRKAVALDMPGVVIAKSSRRPNLEEKAAAEVPRAPVSREEGAAPPNTQRETERDPAVIANNDPRPAIVSTTSRKRLKLLRAEKRAVDTRADPEATAQVKAFLARVVQPGGGALPSEKR